MAKKPLGKAAVRGAKPPPAGRAKAVHGGAKTGEPAVSKARSGAMMRAAERSGLLRERSDRVSPTLEDNFAKAFKEARGKVAPKLELGL